MNVVLAVRYAPARLALELALSEEPGVTVVGAASETEGMLALARAAQPDLVLLEALRGDLRLKPRALQAGACAFVLVGDPPELLLAALRQERAALRGEPPFLPTTAFVSESGNALP